MKVTINNKDGVILKTKKKYCDDDIVVSISDSLLKQLSGVIEIFTSEEMDLAFKEENIGKIYRFLGETNEKYVNGALYMIEEE